MTAEQEAQIKQQLARVADATFSNSKLIEENRIQNSKLVEENRAQNAAAHAELMEKLDKIGKAVYGNGEPSKGLSYRVAWSEKLIRIIMGLLIVDSIILVIIALVLASHITV